MAIDRHRLHTIYHTSDTEHALSSHGIRTTENDGRRKRSRIVTLYPSLQRRYLHKESKGEKREEARGQTGIFFWQQIAAQPFSTCSFSAQRHHRRFQPTQRSSALHFQARPSQRCSYVHLRTQSRVPCSTAAFPTKNIPSTHF